MEDDIELVYSPLQQSFTRDVHTVDIQIYKGKDDSEWSLEVVDADGMSTVWDDLFGTDKAALFAALSAFEEEGIDNFLAASHPSNLH